MATNGKVKATMTTTEDGTECKVSYTCTPEQQMYLILTIIEHLAETMEMTVLDTVIGIASKLKDK